MEGKGCGGVGGEAFTGMFCSCDSWRCGGEGGRGGGGQAEARGEGRGGRVEGEGHKLIEGVSHKSSMSTCHL
jgi:hypothetical protein